MLIVSATKFRDSINKYLTLSLTEKVSIRSKKYGLFDLTPLSEDEAAELLSKYDKGDNVSKIGIESDKD